MIAHVDNFKKSDAYALVAVYDWSNKFEEEKNNPDKLKIEIVLDNSDISNFIESCKSKLYLKNHYFDSKEDHDGSDASVSVLSLLSL